MAKEQKGKGVLLICCLLVMFTTAFAYYLLYSTLLNVKLWWLSLFCLLFSESFLAIKFLLIQHQTILSGAYITSGVIHFLLSLMSAVLFFAGIIVFVRPYLLINAILTSCLALFDLLLFYFQKNISK